MIKFFRRMRLLYKYFHVYDELSLVCKDPISVLEIVDKTDEGYIKLNENAYIQWKNGLLEIHY